MSTLADVDVSMRSLVLTRRLCVLNLPLGTDWWQLKEFVHKAGAPACYIWVTEGHTSCWGIMEFPTVVSACHARDILNEREYTPGCRLYVRQDRDDRYLPAVCTMCGTSRNPGLRGEWWGKQWFCWPCATVNPCDTDQEVFDTHCHLDEVLKCSILKDNEILDALGCLGKGPVTCITSCCDRDGLQQTKRLLILAQQVPHVRIYAALGIHPKKADQWDKEYLCMMEEAMEECDGRVIAWGECGLDFSLYIDNLDRYASDIAHQKRVLAENIQIADRKQLPLVLHTRDCEKDLVDLLEECMHRFQRAQIHCAILSPTAIERLTTRFPNIYFGMAGFLSLEDSRAWPVARTVSGDTVLDLHHMVHAIPFHRMVLETDAPAFRVCSGGPCDVLRTAEVIAHIRNVPYPFVVEQCMRNAHELYGV
eukprot:GEMP01024794.1.p1 GENE.GEMP01024794.1~~GEMP01024794.1.p1  ORF type:complete len:421 (+),score=118.22 GEMP01024794.1:122-1384(+)